MTAEDVYRRLMAVYPARFHREYGEGMLEAFCDLRQHTARGPLAFYRRTLMFNGYGDQVASLYKGMDLRRFY